MSTAPRGPLPRYRQMGFAMYKNLSHFVLVLIITALSGCGVRSVPGGTVGTLQIGGDFLSDIQVTVHQVEGDSTHPVGFGVTDAEGAFELVTNGAHGALWLSPGEYRCTLESAGAPVQLPVEYAQAETTPIKVSWSESDGSLDLAVPAA